MYIYAQNIIQRVAYGEQVPLARSKRRPWPVRERAVRSRICRQCIVEHIYLYTGIIDINGEREREREMRQRERSDVLHEVLGIQLAIESCQAKEQVRAEQNLEAVYSLLLYIIIYICRYHIFCLFLILS